jgi:hypothetical protein
MRNLYVISLAILVAAIAAIMFFPVVFILFVKLACDVWSYYADIFSTSERKAS